MSEAESAYYIIRSLAEEHGWSDATIIRHLCGYLDKQRSNDALRNFLQRVIDGERARAGLCTACLHSAHYNDSCDHDNCNCEA